MLKNLCFRRRHNVDGDQEGAVSLLPRGIHTNAILCVGA